MLPTTDNQAEKQPRPEVPAAAMEAAHERTTIVEEAEAILRSAIAAQEAAKQQQNHNDEWVLGA